MLKACFKQEHPLPGNCDDVWEFGLLPEDNFSYLQTSNPLSTELLFIDVTAVYTVAFIVPGSTINIWTSFSNEKTALQSFY